MIVLSWTRRGGAVALRRLDLDDLRLRRRTRTSISRTRGVEAGHDDRGGVRGPADEDRDVAVAWAAAADMDCTVLDVQGARLVAVDFDAGAETAGEEAARHFVC
jgi:hypothetical protein